jgi:hypothetical protein
MKNLEWNDVSRNILFCLSDFTLQRYVTSTFEKNVFFTKKQLSTTFTSQFCTEILI